MIPLRIYSSMSQSAANLKLMPAVLTIVALAVSILASLLIATGQSLFGAMLSSLFILPVGVLLYFQVVGARHDGIFWIVILSVFFAQLVGSAFGQQFSFLYTAVLLAVGPIIVLSVLKNWHVSRHLPLAVALVVAFFVVGFLSSIFGRSKFVAGTYTTIMTLKPFLIVGFGAALLWTPRSDHVFSWIVRWAWLPLIIVALIQWFAPSFFNAVLWGTGERHDGNPILPGFPRASGIFGHPGILAILSATFGIYCLVDVFLRRNRFLAIPMAFYFTLIVMSGERQELAAFLVACLLFLTALQWRLSIWMLVFLLMSAIFIVGSFMYIIIPHNIENELRYWGMLGFDAPISPRAILYTDAVRIANDFSPLGSGFGTFASAGAIRFDQSMFDVLGYRSFWWYTSESYLHDSYWAKYIAETGWLGFLLKISFYFVVAHAIIGWLRDQELRRNPETFRFSMMALLGLFLVIVNSPTATSLSDIHGSLLSLVFVGVAWQRVLLLRNAK